MLERGGRVGGSEADFVLLRPAMSSLLKNFSFVELSENSTGRWPPASLLEAGVFSAEVYRLDLGNTEAGAQMPLGDPMINV